MKKPNPTSRAVATDKKRQVILRAPEMRRALNRSLLESALKEFPCNVCVTFQDTDNQQIVDRALNDPNNILYRIHRMATGDTGNSEIFVPGLPWILKALADTGAKFTLTELT